MLASLLADEVFNMPTGQLLLRLLIDVVDRIVCGLEFKN
jgi:hypothetical protein